GVLDLADTALDGDPDAEAILNRLRDQGFFDEVAERQSSHMIEGSSLNDVPTLSRTDIDELDYDDLELALGYRRAKIRATEQLGTITYHLLFPNSGWGRSLDSALDAV